MGLTVRAKKKEDTPPTKTTTKKAAPKFRKTAAKNETNEESDSLIRDNLNPAETENRSGAGVAQPIKLKFDPLAS